MSEWRPAWSLRCVSGAHSQCRKFLSRCRNRGVVKNFHVVYQYLRSYPLTRSVAHQTRATMRRSRSLATRRQLPTLARAWVPQGQASCIAIAMIALLPMRGSSQGIDQMVLWKGTLQLEDSRDALLVAPHAVASASGLTIADLREFRVSQYSHEGRRLRLVGRRGGGPGEFESPPLTARPMPDGGLLVAEFSGRLHRFGAAGDSARTSRVPLFPFYDARRLDDDRVLLVGWGPIAQRERAERGSLLHEWSTREQRIRKSYFVLPVADAQLALARSLGSVATVISGDTILAVFALTDTIYKFTVSDGTLVAKLPIRSSLLKRIADAPNAFRSVAERSKWLEQVSVIDALYQLRDGRLLVQFSERYGVLRRYRLLLLDASGTVLAQASEAPQLMAVAEGAGEPVLLFANRDDDEPNIWRRAELRP